MTVCGDGDGGGGTETVMTVVVTREYVLKCSGVGVSVGGGVRWYSYVSALLVLLWYVVLAWRMVVVVVVVAYSSSDSNSSVYSGNGNVWNH